MTCDRVDVVFNNSRCIELRGCILYCYKNGVEVGHDGVRPCPPQDGIRFYVEGHAMTHWRWVGAADYSDRPENTDVVMVDTGMRELTKCNWTIDCSRASGQPFEVV